MADVKIVMHVITDQATLEGREHNPGFLDGHGVISADHVRDIADREETVQRPMVNTTAPAPAQSKPEAEPTPEPEPEPAPEPDQEPEPEPEPKRTKPKRPEVYMRGPQNPPIDDFPGGLDETEPAKPPFVQVVPLPSTQPGDRYRASAVLDSYIRIRGLLLRVARLQPEGLECRPRPHLRVQPRRSRCRWTYTPLRDEGTLSFSSFDQDVF